LAPDPDTENPSRAFNQKTNKKFFSNFVLQLTKFFSIHDDEFIELARTFSRRIVDIHELVVEKKIDLDVFNERSVRKWKDLLNSFHFAETENPEVWRDQVKQRLKGIIEGFDA
jgi:hypothetical protein